MISFVALLPLAKEGLVYLALLEHREHPVAQGPLVCPQQTTTTYRQEVREARALTRVVMAERVLNTILNHLPSVRSVRVVVAVQEVITVTGRLADAESLERVTIAVVAVLPQRPDKLEVLETRGPQVQLEGLELTPRDIMFLEVLEVVVQLERVDAVAVAVAVVPAGSRTVPIRLVDPVVAVAVAASVEVAALVVQVVVDHSPFFFGTTEPVALSWIVALLQVLVVLVELAVSVVQVVPVVPVVPVEPVTAVELVMEQMVVPEVPEVLEVLEVPVPRELVSH
jgi:hypothetical protein